MWKKDCQDEKRKKNKYKITKYNPFQRQFVQLIWNFKYNASVRNRISGLEPPPPPKKKN